MNFDPVVLSTHCKGRDIYNSVHDLCRALLRPGRFDVEVRVFPPDLKGRKEIIEFYVGKVKTDSSKKLVCLFHYCLFCVRLLGVGVGGDAVLDLPAILFRYLFHPCVTTVARKRSRSFCQKCRWQVTTKHAYTLHMWLCMK